MVESCSGKGNNHFKPALPHENLPIQSVNEPELDLGAESYSEGSPDSNKFISDQLKGCDISE